MIKRICDKCEKDIDNNKCFYITISDFPIESGCIQHQQSRHYDTYELCQHCVQELVKNLLKK